MSSPRLGDHLSGRSNHVATRMPAWTKRVRWWVETAMVAVTFAMVALTFADVLGRRLLGVPIYGAHDITEHLMALLVFIGLPLVTTAGGHLTVDLFDRYLSSEKMRVWRWLVAMLIAIIFGLLAYLFIIAAIDAAAISELSQALYIPRAPVLYFMSVCCALAAVGALYAGFGGKQLSPRPAKEVS